MDPKVQTALAVIAVCISSLSLLLAGASLGWNIYRDVILKSRLKVKLSVSNFMVADGLPHPPNIKIVLSCLNLGPKELKITSICSLTYKTGLLGWFHIINNWGFMAYDYREPLSAKLPAKIDVGDGIDLVFPYVEGTFLSDNNFSRIGLTDSFGRHHWIKHKQLTEARKQYAKDFDKNKRNPEKVIAKEK